MWTLGLIREGEGGSHNIGGNQEVEQSMEELLKKLGPDGNFGDRA